VIEGHLIAIEGLDQSGKQTQAARLVTRLTERGHRVELFSFPDYKTHIGTEIDKALHNEREYDPDVMQLLYIANRYEKRPQIEELLARQFIVVCDRYLASSIAYGEAFGLDPEWLSGAQKYLPEPSLTLLLDIAPTASLSRKQLDRDRYERDLALLDRVRASYQRQAAHRSWQLIDGAREKDAVAADVIAAVQTRLGLL
jgi:dTMP kinase